MTYRFVMASLLCAILFVWEVAPAAAQGRAACVRAPTLEASSNPAATKTALDQVNEVVGTTGTDTNFQAVRDGIIKNNPKADQRTIVGTMASAYCERIWSDPALSAVEKVTRVHTMMQAMLTRASGPAAIARTGARDAGLFEIREQRILLASTDVSGLQLAQLGETEFILPEPQTGYLRDPPYYVNDSNKYFVIVGSRKSREAGLSLMNRLKANSPQYDFALYAPYGNNPYFAVMMASWVPRDVAMEALLLARRDVVPDAYLWACRSSGAGC